MPHVAHSFTYHRPQYTQYSKMLDSVLQRPACMRPAFHHPHILLLQRLLISPILLLLLLSCPHPNNSQSLESLTSLALTVSFDRFANLALKDVTLAYRVQQPDVSFTVVPSPSAAAIVAGVISHQFDFGSTSTGLTAAQAASYPTMNLYPVLASGVAPVWRLDAFSGTGAQLVISRAALAAIYEGQLTWWNDSRLQSTNPSVTMPALPITVVYHNESLALVRRTHIHLSTDLE